MLLQEMFQKPNEAYQDVANDNSQPRLGDLRKTKLTLRQISKLRRLNDLKQVEYKENLKQIKTQYSPPAQPMMP